MKDTVTHPNLAVTEQDRAFMREAIRLANESVAKGGGPFGAAIDFDDNFIYQEMDTPLSRRTIPIIPMLRDEALESFRLWSEKSDKTPY